MIFNEHKELEGKHAFLGASQWRWLNWNDETLVQRYYSQYAQTIGTVIHNLAHDCICNGMKLNKSDKHVIDMYMYQNFIPKNVYNSELILNNLINFVNDAIGFHMRSEVVLYYSKNAFGTTDAIGYNEKEKTLRIHDLKNGETPGHIEQPMVYAAYFCLEYKMAPTSMAHIYLRLYQNGEYVEVEADPMQIENIMKLTKSRDAQIEELKGVYKK